MKKKPDEENFDEALAQAYRTWAPTTLPSSLTSLFDSIPDTLPEGAHLYSDILVYCLGLMGFICSARRFSVHASRRRIKEIRRRQRQILASDGERTGYESRHDELCCPSTAIPRAGRAGR